MDTQAIIAALDAEIARLQHVRAILKGQTGVKRRGRPPKNPPPLGHDGPFPMVKKGRRTFTATQRKQQAQRMRKYWAAKKKAAKKS